MLIVWVGSMPILADMSIKNIEKMVKEIRAKRISKINNKAPVVSPFIVVKKDENKTLLVKVSDKASRTNFLLGAIVNSEAFIDGAWRKKGDKIGDFRLNAIRNNHVVLKMKNRTITLYFRKAKKISNIGKE
jgi:hypothetical protein